MRDVIVAGAGPGGATTAHELVAYMVMRDRFDHFLAEKAQGAGAEEDRPWWT